MNKSRRLTNGLGVAIVVLLVLNLVAPALHGQKPAASQPVAAERKAVALAVTGASDNIYRLWSDGTIEWMGLIGQRKWRPLVEVP